jgi:DNA-binding PadR family transcriptional regulator
VTSNKDSVKRLITRLLIDREISGYDTYKELIAKGVALRSNYLYMILTEMRDEGLLKARWVNDQKGRRKHLYSLSERGQEEFRQQVRDSLDVMMDGFVHANLNTRDLSDHLFALKGAFAWSGMPPPGEGSKFVFTIPSFDPLSCYPLQLRVASEMYPTVSVFVVKPSGVKYYDDRPNVTFVDGQRHDMPLKDGFADYLMLEGFPKAVPETKTISECARVLNDRGQLIVRVPGVMVEENKPRFNNFAEFALRQYYDYAGQDRIVSITRVRSLLAGCFGKLKDAEVRGTFVMHAGEKKNAREPGNPLTMLS